MVWRQLDFPFSISVFNPLSLRFRDFRFLVAPNLREREFDVEDKKLAHELHEFPRKAARFLVLTRETGVNIKPRPQGRGGCNLFIRAIEDGDRISLSQYASRDFTNQLKRYGMIQSMSREGNCRDNAVAVRFFISVKEEQTNRFWYKTRDELVKDVFDYIEVFYNQKHLHSTLGYMSPAAFEAQAFIR